MESLFRMVGSVEDVIHIQNDLERTETISLDIETTGVDFKDDIILLIQFRINRNTYLIDVRNLPEKVTKYILELMEATGKPVLAHNAKFDIKFIYEKYGILFKNIHCSMITEYLIAEAREKYASYQELCQKYLGEIVEKDTVQKFVDIKLTNAQLSQDMLIYGAIDVLWLDEIRTKQLKLIEEKKMKHVYELEMQLMHVVIIMECNGVLIDYNKWMGLYEDALQKSEEMERQIIDTVWEYCKEKVIPKYKFDDVIEFFNFMNIPVKPTKKEQKYLKEISLYQESIEKEFKERLNLASPKQVKTFLNVMGAKVKSTGVKVLKKIADKYPVAKMLLDFRKHYKRVTTYGLKFLDSVREDGRVYAEFNQIGTETGRFSSKNPNLQNIIAGSEYRECFIAPKGKVLITADYSQQEFRLAGELSGEPVIIEAYQKGLDMHTATASMLFHIPLEEVTHDQRSKGKTVNFAVLYGSSAYGLSKTMGISEEEAQALLDRFIEGFPRLSAFQKNIQDLVWKVRYSVTPIGRRRGFKKHTDKVGKEYYKFRGQVNREGFNHVVQGGSADMIKYALLMLQDNNPWDERFKIVITVHDEIVVEVDEEIAEEAKEYIVDTMVKAGEIMMEKIPTAVGATIKPYWSK